MAIRSTNFASRLVNDSSRLSSRGSPVPAISGSLISGLALAVLLVLTVGVGGTEPSVTGSGLLAFGIGWGLLAYTTSRFSAQPQSWAIVPAAILGTIGIVLIVVQPGPAVMDIVSWIWPPALAGLADWMVMKVRQQLRGRGRLLVAPMIATLLVFALGGALTTVGPTSIPVASAAASGRLIDVDGHRLYIECTGSGGPTVILQAGMGASSPSWAAIAPTVAGATTVCAYDRAGHGRSDEAGPQDGIALAADLHTLLDRAGVPGPYVLVGHSSGGAYVRVFAARYPDEVAGMVLLDPQPADAFAALPDYPGTYATIKTVAALSPSLARVGLLGAVLGLPADESTVEIARGARDEVFVLPIALEQASALTSIGDLPLIVVTAVAESQSGWVPAHDSIARLSSESIHRVMPDATHNSLISGEDAPASARAILDVLDSIRTGTALR